MGPLALVPASSTQLETRVRYFGRVCSRFQAPRVYLRPARVPESSFHGQRQDLSCHCHPRAWTSAQPGLKDWPLAPTSHCSSLGIMPPSVVEENPENTRQSLGWEACRGSHGMCSPNVAFWSKASGSSEQYQRSQRFDAPPPPLRWVRCTSPGLRDSS